MSQKTALIKDAVRTCKNIISDIRHLNFISAQYKDNTWTTGGADEIVQQDITDAGYEFTPAQLKACVDTTEEALYKLMNNDMPTQSDYEKKLNAIISMQE